MIKDIIAFMAMSFEELRHLSTKFRLAIEHCDRKRLPISLQEFPAGSCGDAALLLARYLLENKAGSFDYILGCRSAGGSRHSHAWLEGEGFIVDISGDQFPEVVDPVIVTESSSFHDTFERENLHTADYRIYDPQTVITLNAAYSAILAELTAGEE